MTGSLPHREKQNSNIYAKIKNAILIPSKLSHPNRVFCSLLVYVVQRTPGKKTGVDLLVNTAS